MICIIVHLLLFLHATKKTSCSRNNHKNKKTNFPSIHPLYFICFFFHCRRGHSCPCPAISTPWTGRKFITENSNLQAKFIEILCSSQDSKRL